MSRQTVSTRGLDNVYSVSSEASKKTFSILKCRLAGGRGYTNFITMSSLKCDWANPKAKFSWTLINTGTGRDISKYWIQGVMCDTYFGFYIYLFFCHSP
jgi:hypothetical protein